MKTRVKLLIWAGFLLSGIAGFSLGAKASGDIRLGASEKIAEVGLRIFDNISYVPMRALSELLGFSQGNITYKAGPLTLYNVAMQKDDYGWNIAADAINLDQKSYKAINLTAVYYNNQGTRIGIATGTVFDLNPGETKTIRFATVDDLTDYSTIKFQTDFIY